MECSSFSVLVLMGVILVSGFDTVTGMAEALPIVLIPKENLVTSMRLDVIYISRLDIASMLHALHTQRMCLKVTLAGSVPRPAVAAAASGACILRMERTVLAAVLGAVWHEHRTAGVSAWGIGSAGHWHCLHSFHCDRAVSPAVLIVGLWSV